MPMPRGMASGKKKAVRNDNYRSFRTAFSVSCHCLLSAPHISFSLSVLKKE